MKMFILVSINLGFEFESTVQAGGEHHNYSIDYIIKNTHNVSLRQLGDIKMSYFICLIHIYYN